MNCTKTTDTYRKISNHKEDQKKELIEMLICSKALNLGSFQLKSGRISPYFCNFGKLSSGHEVMKIGEAFAHIIHHSSIEYDLLFGPAYKGIPLVTAAAIGLYQIFEKNVDFTFNRKEIKDHGEGGQLVGASLFGKKVLIIDDVITAGTAINQSIEIILKEGGIPVGAAVAFDREEKTTNSDLSAIQQAQKEHGIQIVSIIKCQDLFKFMQENEAFNEHSKELAAYRLKYGV